MHKFFSNELFDLFFSNSFEYYIQYVNWTFIFVFLKKYISKSDKKISYIFIELIKYGII